MYPHRNASTIQYPRKIPNIHTSKCFPYIFPKPSSVQYFNIYMSSKQKKHPTSNYKKGTGTPKLTAKASEKIGQILPQKDISSSSSSKPRFSGHVFAVSFREGIYIFSNSLTSLRGPKPHGNPQPSFLGVISYNPYF